MSDSLFSGMGVKENFASLPHIDEDYGFDFIPWFLSKTQCRSLRLCAGGGFLMLECGMYMQPRHGTILCFKANVVYHWTRKNIGYTEIGACVYTKMKLVSGANKRRIDIHLEYNKI